jgi:cell division protein FtsL
VKERKRRTVRLFHFLLIMLSLFLLAGISHVWANFKRTQMGYTLSQLKKEILQIEEHNRKLKLEIAYLRSPEHLERRAIKEFGLIHPMPKQIVFLP